MSAEHYTAEDWKAARIRAQAWLAEWNKRGPQHADDPDQETMFGVPNNAHKHRRRRAAEAQGQLFSAPNGDNSNG